MSNFEALFQQLAMLRKKMRSDKLELAPHPGVDAPRGENHVLVKFRIHIISSMQSNNDATLHIETSIFCVV